MSIDFYNIMCYIRHMFDRIVYKTLDTIISWCERYKKFRKTRSLPKECWDEDTKKAGLKKWVKQRESLINKHVD